VLLVPQSVQRLLLAGTIEREEKTRTWVKQIAADAAIVKRWARTIEVERSAAAQTARSSERSVEQRMILPESLLTSLVVRRSTRGAKTKLVMKATKDLGDVGTNLVMTAMSDARNVVRSYAALQLIIQSKFAAPRARLLCRKLLSILFSTRFQMMHSRLQL
jgi:hypothetical protein